jgi:hypothetical protein
MIPDKTAAWSHEGAAPGRGGRPLPCLSQLSANVPGRLFPVTCFDDCEITPIAGLRAVGAMPVRHGDLLGLLA